MADCFTVVSFVVTSSTRLELDDHSTSLSFSRSCIGTPQMFQRLNIRRHHGTRYKSNFERRAARSPGYPSSKWKANWKQMKATRSNFSTKVSRSQFWKFVPNNVRQGDTNYPPKLDFWRTTWEWLQLALVHGDLKVFMINPRWIWLSSFSSVPEDILDV